MNHLKGYFFFLSFLNNWHFWGNYYWVFLQYCKYLYAIKTSGKFTWLKSSYILFGCLKACIRAFVSLKLFLYWSSSVATIVNMALHSIIKSVINKQHEFVCQQALQVEVTAQFKQQTGGTQGFQSWKKYKAIEITS